MNSIFPESFGPKIKTNKKVEWVEGMFSKDSSVLDIGHEYIAPKATASIYLITVTVMGLIGALLLGRLVYLQIIKGEYYAEMSESNRIRKVRIAAPRGVIVDRNNIQLTKNIATFALHVIPKDIPQNTDRIVFVKKIAEIMDQKEEDVEKKLQDAQGVAEREVILYEYVTRQQAIALSVLASQLPSLIVANNVTRAYNDEHGRTITSLSHILGYEGKISEEELKNEKENGYTRIDRFGKAGVEKAEEKNLRGEHGERLLEVNASGVPLSTVAEIAPKEGNKVQITIDSDLQEVAQRALERQLKISNKVAGAVLIEQVATGEILASVSLPAYDNNEFVHGIAFDKYELLTKNPATPLLNRVTQGLYPSGSVVKPTVALAALEEKIIDVRTRILSTGGIKLGARFFPDWKFGGHGSVTVKEAIAESVNTFFYYVGGGYEDFKGMGVTKLAQWLSLMGFGEVRGIDVGRESAGFVPTPQWKEEKQKSSWYTGDTYNLAIGQGEFLVTPLQISGSIQAILNDGVQYRPHIIKAVVKEGIIQEKKPEISRVIKAKKDNYAIIRDAMRETVINGSARSLGTLSITSGGKTGTAQSNPSKKPHAWYTGFAPYENPEIIITVLIDEGEEGSRVAVPVAKEILEYYGNRKSNSEVGT